MTPRQPQLILVIVVTPGEYNGLSNSDRFCLELNQNVKVSFQLLLRFARAAR